MLYRLTYDCVSCLNNGRAHIFKQNHRHHDEAGDCDVCGALSPPADWARVLAVFEPGELVTLEVDEDHMSVPERLPPSGTVGRLVEYSPSYVWAWVDFGEHGGVCKLPAVLLTEHDPDDEPLPRTFVECGYCGWEIHGLLEENVPDDCPECGGMLRTVTEPATNGA